jgi:hypothetical protein
MGSKKTLGLATTPASSSKGNKKGSITTTTTITWLISLEEIS